MSETDLTPEVFPACSAKSSSGEPITRKLPLREELQEVTPYGAPQLDVPVRLNVNENPYPPSAQMVADIQAAVAAAARNLNRYADRDFWQLRAGLADYLAKESQVHFPPTQIWAANGSNEVITHVLAAYSGPGRIVMSTECTYSMYPEYARNAHARYVTVPRYKQFFIDLPAVKEQLARLNPAVFLLANPNNPTGTALAPDQQLELIKYAQNTGPDGTQTIVLIDEAYAEFRSPGTPSALQWINDYSNLVVCRTMSKSFGMAGLRLGYLVANPQVIKDIMRVRLPYHLSGLSQAAAQAALKHADRQLAQLAELRQRRDQLASWLEKLGYTVPRSEANFVLFGRFDNPDQVFAQLLERGVLIRQVGPPGFLRVTVGTSSEMEIFCAALKEVTSKPENPASRIE